MAKQYRMVLTICLILVILLSGLQCDGTFYTIPLSMNLPDTIVATESSVSESSSRYISLEKQDCWSVGNVACVSFFMKRLQSGQKSYQRRNLLHAILKVIFKVVLYSIVMILFATGGTGLSMAFRCLLYYIHNIDGKKEAASVIKGGLLCVHICKK